MQKTFAIDERTSVWLFASCLSRESLDGVECAWGGQEVRAGIGAFFSLVSRNGFLNVEAGHLARDDCEGNVFEVATGLGLAISWNLGRKAWHDGGSGLSTKVQLNLGCNFDGLRVWVVLASRCF